MEAKSTAEQYLIFYRLDEIISADISLIFFLIVKELTFMPTTLLTVTRHWHTQKTTISTFKTRVGAGKPVSSVAGYILEKKRLQPLGVINSRYIPAGIYTLKWHYGGKFGRKMPFLYNREVPASRLILIHKGNYPKDTEGCLLPGSIRKTDIVENSQTKLKELLAFLDGYDINSGNFYLKLRKILNETPKTSGHVLFLRSCPLRLVWQCTGDRNAYQYSGKLQHAASTTTR